MAITTERRIRKRINKICLESIDAALSYDAKLRREMLSVTDRLVEDITTSFAKLLDIAKKYTFLTPL